MFQRLKKTKLHLIILFVFFVYITLWYYININKHTDTLNEEFLKNGFKNLEKSNENVEKIEGDIGKAEKIKEDIEKTEKTKENIEKISNKTVVADYSNYKSEKRVFNVFDSRMISGYKCGYDDIEIKRTSDLTTCDLAVYLSSMPNFVADKRNHYTMVYEMESEAHSHGSNWLKADFHMWYNLEKSFPEPATYFDIKLFLPDLLAPPVVEFEKKNQEVSIVWVISNCGSNNKREVFVRNLMKHMSVDSYGGCLKNKHTHSSKHMVN
jgi:hypothetical protein